MRIRDFMNRHYRHFNAREAREAAQGWCDLIDRGGAMFVTMAGAMSTAELGISLAAMIRAGKVGGICTTGANLEEDVFNLIAHDDYRIVDGWRDLRPEDEAQLYEAGMNRVTDTAIPETVMRQVEERLIALWRRGAETGRRFFPAELLMTLLDDESLTPHYQIPPEDSWLLAAKAHGVPVWVPGWEDSTLGNMFTAWNMRPDAPERGHQVMRSGTEQLQELADWYTTQATDEVPVGFFQIGGGIAGDFPICVVPMLLQDLKRADTPFWAYFAQISDSTTSYGSYSGAVPREKISWGKLDARTPTYMIESDASLVAPLVFGYVLDL